MSLPIIYKGADEVINITITDSAGAPITISTLSDVIVSIYQTREQIIQQWSIGNSDLVVVNDAGGIVQANLDRDNTTEIPLKRLYLEVVAELSNSEFESNTQRMIVSDIDLADLKNSVI
ncbi:hypothetical protein UFOVP1605_27 [uncultured Caudovirales phage]|uniref:Uncharacterized protein n=1 Tax=uncultured Caudovirales phage TaxID=2100421 RepID=A0A6J5SV36_9CAUD|nr:hypothetical protein UFOVP1605_27 [uncultured Caudovirales phage]